MANGHQNDRIAYHPLRLTSHASLFLPLSDCELAIYNNQSLNTLRKTPAIPTTNTHPSHPQAHSQSQSQSPPGYTTPSPLAAPFQSSSSSSTSIRPHQQPQPFDPHQRPPSHSNKRPHHSMTTDSQESYSSLTDMLSHPIPAEPVGHLIKRTRHGYPPTHLISVDLPNSISQTVAQHYNSRPNLTKNARVESPIFGLRKLNNWIKSVIIGKFGSVDSDLMIPLLKQQQNSKNITNISNQTKGTKVLELGCGKGGDLAKWQNAGVRELYGFDIANVSIEQAQSRYLQSCKKKFYAKFVALDCFSLPITSVLTPEELREPFHAVSLQFCMHYAFETESKARMMLDNVSKFLMTGGVMIGTIPNPDLLITRWQECSRNDPDPQPSFGNSVYQIRFPYRLNPNSQDQEFLFDQIYGNKYMFYLQDAVEDVPEYLVLWEPFVKLAKEYRLKLIYKNGFHDLFEDEKSNLNSQGLLSRMNVIDSQGNISVSNEQWEASGIYLAFAFIKE